MRFLLSRGLVIAALALLAPLADAPAGGPAYYPAYYYPAYSPPYYPAYYYPTYTQGAVNLIAPPPELAPSPCPAPAGPLFSVPPDSFPAAPAVPAAGELAPTTSPTAPGTPAETVTVGVFDNYFEPKTITVAPGTAVRWTNRGRGRHTITSNDRIFDSGELSPGADYRYTFTRPGVYSYYCRLHPEAMRATVIVK